MTPPNFKVIRRNFGHWDILVDGKGRAFRIRGEPGEYIVIDERTSPRYKETECKTVAACMAFVCDNLMYENLTLQGSNPTIVDKGGNEVQS